MNACDKLFSKTTKVQKSFQNNKENKEICDSYIFSRHLNTEYGLMSDFVHMVCLFVLQVHPKLCITDLVAVQQRGDDCANVAINVLRSIVEKYPVYFTPEVWVQGLLKGVILKREDQPVMVDLFARAFELRSNDKAFVQRTIKYGVEKIEQRPTDPEPSDVAAGLASKCFLLTVLSSLPYAHEDHVSLIVTRTGEAGVNVGTTCLAELESMLESLDFADDVDLLYACEEDCRSYLLLESKRFLASTYKNVLVTTTKTALPLVDVPHVELTIPYKLDQQDARDIAQDCCHLLEHALYLDANEAARSARKTPATKGRAREKDANSDEESSESDFEQTPASGRSRVPGSAASGRNVIPRSTKKSVTPRERTTTPALKFAMELDDDEDDGQGSDQSLWSSDDDWE